MAICLTLRGGRFLSEWTLLSHGLRMGVPLALLLVDRAGGGTQLAGGAERVLRWAAALTFLAHGWKAWQLSPEFTSMVIAGWPEPWAGRLSQQTAERILRVIGATDIVVAILVLLVRWPWLALYMAVWGVISAAGRTLGFSEANYPETLLRLVHAGGPLALFLEWRNRNDAAQRRDSSPPSSSRPLNVRHPLLILLILALVAPAAADEPAVRRAAPPATAWCPRRLDDRPVSRSYRCLGYRRRWRGSLSDAAQTEPSGR